MLYRLTTITILIIGLAALSACSGKDDPEDNPDRVDLHILTADKVAKLDPHATDSGGDSKAIIQVYETLVRLDPKDPNVVKPMLASAYEVQNAEDGSQSLVFTMRKGVTFHDGAKLDAKAAKMNLERVAFGLIPAITVPYSSSFQIIDSVDAEGMTLTVGLKRPVGEVALRNLTMFSASMVSPKVLSKIKKMDGQRATEYVTKNAAGTGAFKVKSFEASTGILRLSANAKYWGGAPKVNNVLFEGVSDNVQRFERFKKGQVQMCDALPRQNWSEVEKSKNHSLISSYVLNVCYLGLNAKHPKMGSDKLREAIQLCIEREPIVELYQDTARATWSLLPNQFAESVESSPLENWNNDVSKRRERARSLIQASGIGDEVLTIYYPKMERPYLPNPPSVADKLAQQLRECGLNAKIQGIENSELFESIADDDNYEMVLIGWMSDNGHPDNFMLPLTSGDPDTQEPSSANVSRTYNSTVHRLLMAGQQARDAETRVQTYRSAETMLQNTVRGYVPLVNAQQAIGTVKALKGVEVDSLGNYRLAKVEIK